MKYLAGQWLWLCIPSISHLQWHPFTITSAPSDPHVSINVRCVGDWTDELARRVVVTEGMEHVAATISSAMTVSGDIKIRVHGPFGAVTELVYKERASICVGSGIGITLWASVLKDIWYNLMSFIFSLLVL